MRSRAKLLAFLLFVICFDVQCSIHKISKIYSWNGWIFKKFFSLDFMKKFAKNIFSRISKKILVIFLAFKWHQKIAAIFPYSRLSETTKRGIYLDHEEENIKSKCLKVACTR